MTYSEPQGSHIILKAMIMFMGIVYCLSTVYAWSWDNYVYNFNINNSTGVVRYNPLNQTWLNFDGVNDYVSYGSLYPTNQSFNNITISLWVKPNTLNLSYSSARILDKQSRYIISYSNNTGSLAVDTGGLTDNTYNFGYNIQKDTWTQIVFSYDGQYMRGWINGDFLNEDDSNGIISGNNSFNMYLGGRGGTGYYFNGSIDDLKLYNLSLSPAQIRNLYINSSKVDNNIISIPVLMHHKICDPSTSYLCVSEDQLNNEFSYLKSLGYESITDIEYYNYTLGKISIPNKSFMMMWDDGELTTYVNVSNISAKYGYKGIMSIDTGNVGDTGNMNWTQINTMINVYNWSIASHSNDTCSLLLECNNTVQLAMSNSKMAIIGNTSITPLSFVFPKNEYNSSLISFCSSNYTLCWADATTFSSAKYITKFSNFTNGELDRIKAYNDTVDNISLAKAFDFSFDYNNGLTLASRIDEFTGNITYCYDSIGNINNGVISGATWANDGIGVYTNYVNALFNITQLVKSLVFWDNYTLIKNNYNGNVSLSFYYNQSVYALDNFNLTENSPREYSPIWIASKIQQTVTSDNSYISYHIDSNLSESINNITFYPTAGILCPNSLKYTSHNGMTLVSYNCSGGYITNVTLGYVDYGQGSNELILYYTKGLYEPFDFKNILFNDLAGNVEIAGFLMIILLSIGMAKLGMTSKLALPLYVLFAVIMAVYIQPLYVLIILVTGLVTFYSVSRYFQ